MFKTVRGFVKSIDFFKSVTLLFSILVLLGAFYLYGDMSRVASVVMGVFICSSSDVPGSRRHMSFGILMSSTIATLTTLIIHLSFTWSWLRFPVLGLMVFANSMIAVFGFRASLVSFSGLLAIILSYAHPTSGIDLLIHAGLILLGGMWYWCVAMLAHALIQRSHNQLILSECMSLTARYLKTRGELLQSSTQDQAKQDDLFLLQTDINEKHEKLREIFVEERVRSGASYSANKYILILIELIDILELAISNPANYQVLSTYFKGETEALKPFVVIINTISARLELLAEVITDNRPLKAGEDMKVLYEQAEAVIEHYILEKHSEEAVILRNLLDYEQKQQQKIESMERVLQNLVDQEQLRNRSKDAEKFITHQDYDLSIIKQNLNAGSTIFRHAIRLTFTVLFGYTLGTFLPIHMPYWIMLTIIVIMRPSYGLTKSRSIKRVYGTLIGGAIALGIVLLTQNPIVYGVIAAVSLIFAFSLVQKNYGGSAIFITLIVIFLYALMRPNAMNVIQYRVVDTVIGAGLSFLASLFFWPSWEVMNIQSVIADSIKANRKYLQEISTFYQNKGDLPTSYKLARKEAFLAIGNLSAAFQRMSQEPESKRPTHAKIYEMVVLNHTFLTAAAAMGTFIQNHITTEKSQHVQDFMDSIDDCMAHAETALGSGEWLEEHAPLKLAEAKSYLAQQIDQLVEKQAVSTLEKVEKEHLMPHYQLQEVSLISNQLTWLYSLSENIQNIAYELNGQKKGIK